MYLAAAKIRANLSTILTIDPLLLPSLAERQQAMSPTHFPSHALNAPRSGPQPKLGSHRGLSSSEAAGQTSSSKSRRNSVYYAFYDGRQLDGSLLLAKNYSNYRSCKIARVLTCDPAGLQALQTRHLGIGPRGFCVSEHEELQENGVRALREEAFRSWVVSSWVPCVLQSRQGKAEKRSALLSWTLDIVRAQCLRGLVGLRWILWIPLDGQCSDSLFCILLLLSVSSSPTPKNTLNPKP